MFHHLVLTPRQKRFNNFCYSVKKCFQIIKFYMFIKPQILLRYQHPSSSLILTILADIMKLLQSIYF